MIYSDIPLALSIELAAVAGYVREVKRAATEALAEEAVMVAVTRVYHSMSVSAFLKSLAKAHSRKPAWARCEKMTAKGV